MVRWLVLNRKMRTLPKFKAEELRGNINLRLIVRNLHYGDWQLMYALIVNMDGITFAEWLKELTELLGFLNIALGEARAVALRGALQALRSALRPPATADRSNQTRNARLWPPPFATVRGG